jgi:TetR/AcrR family transcriptional regulator, copper-responsive repressor
MKLNLPIPLKRPRGRPRGFDRDVALARAMQVFWEKGYESASMHDLLSAMEISSPSLYAAFGDKEGLFLEAVQRYHANVRGECGGSEAATAREAIEALLTELATLFTDRSHPPGCLAVMALVTAPPTERCQRLISEQRAEGKARIRSRMERGIKEGDLPRGTDAAMLAEFYAAVIGGMALQAREGASRKTLLAMVQTAMRAWPEAPAKHKPSRKAKAAA